MLPRREGACVAFSNLCQEFSRVCNPHTSLASLTQLTTDTLSFPPYTATKSAAMDHRQRAEHYRTQVVDKQKLIEKAEQRIFELEGAIADRDDQLKNQLGGGGGSAGRVKELEGAVADRDAQLKQLTASPNRAQLRIKELEGLLSAATNERKNGDDAMKMEVSDNFLLQSNLTTTATFSETLKQALVSRSTRSRLLTKRCRRSSATRRRLLMLARLRSVTSKLESGARTIRMRGSRRRLRNCN